ncbi:MAG TPA: NAD-dependent epimerase/dehydratase family protein [Bacteroidota bacterium]
MIILITGAAGNLGTQLTRYLIPSGDALRLLVHRKEPAPEILSSPNVTVLKGNLADREFLMKACEGVDCIVHLAGVLFKPRPERFLPVTNTLYVKNLVDAALRTAVRRIILVSFPHVEGETTPAVPARGVLNASPNAIHSRTRLDAEKYLFEASMGTRMEAVVLRAGVIYGKNIKLIEAARSLLRKRMLAIWKTPTWLHLLAIQDFLKALDIAIRAEGIAGIYNVCDDEPVVLQDFLDRLADHWGYPKPPRMPDFVFYWAAAWCQTGALIFRTSAPLTRDIVTMGMTSVVADTSRMKKELLPALSFPTFREGIAVID